MEYNPNIFSLYEQPDAALENNGTQTLDAKELKRYGKFQRKNVQNGHTDKNCALSIFLVASVLETKNRQILKEAKGLDDVAAVRSLPIVPMHITLGGVCIIFSDYKKSRFL